MARTSKFHWKTQLDPLVLLSREQQCMLVGGLPQGTEAPATELTLSLGSLLLA